MFALCTLSYFFMFSSNQLCIHLGTFNWFAHKCCLSIMGLKKILFLCSMFLFSKLFTSSFGFNVHFMPLFCCIFSFLLVMAPLKVPFVGFKSHLLFFTFSNASSSNLTSWHFAHPITRTWGDFSYPFALTTSYISLPSNII